MAHYGAPPVPANVHPAMFMLSEVLGFGPFHRNSSISVRPEIKVNRPKYFGLIQICNPFYGPVKSPQTFPVKSNQYSG
jgi:hypothetical protein